MTFVGAVTKVGDAYVRPHDLEFTSEPNGDTEEVQVRRVVHLGFEVRVELERADGEELVGAAVPVGGRGAGARTGRHRLWVRADEGARDLVR